MTKPSLQKFAYSEGINNITRHKYSEMYLQFIVN